MLNLIPRWVLLYVIVGLAVLAGITTLQANFARTELAKAEAKLAVATQKAEREQRDKEQALQTQANRVAHDDQTRQTVRTAHAVGVDRAVDSLRGTIAHASATSQGASPATLTQDAATARDLLGQCASEYRSVAQVADQLSDQVTGLQDFVETATGISESE